MSTEPARGLAYESLARDLREQILTGRLRPGDRLPVEPELSARYGVSRSTVREALRVLSSQYLITTTRGVAGGSFVVHPKVDQVADNLEVSLGLLASGADVDVDQMLEVRELIEVPAARLAARRATPDDLADLERTLLEPDGTEPAQLQRCHHRFHALVLRAAGNPLLELVSRPVFHVLETRFASPEAPEGFWSEVIADHHEIHDALAAGDADAAAAASHAHLVRLRPTYLSATPPDLERLTV